MDTEGTGAEQEQRSRPSRRHLLTTALAVTIPLTGGVGAFAAATSSTVRTVGHRGIRPDDPDGRAPILNPRRGFRYEMSYNAIDLTSPWPREKSHSPKSAETLSLLEDTYGPGVSLTQLYFYLWEYATTDIPKRALDNIESVLAGLRAKGYAAVLRFVYDDGVRAKRRYTVQNIQRHIGQLAPIVARHSDVVAVWQAGFLGAWGEWAGSYHKHETYPDAVTTIMTTLVEALPAGIHTQMRYAWKRNMITNHQILDRIGFHNDYLTLEGGLYDFYVPSDPHWSTYLDVGTTCMMDGEMPWDKNEDKDPHAWSKVIPGIDVARRLQTLRFDSLSIAHNSTVTIPAWRKSTMTEKDAVAAQLPISDGYFRDRAGKSVPRTHFEYVRDHLGYRLEIQQARYDVGELTSRKLPVEVDLVNRGFAPPKHPRPAYLVLLDAEGKTVAQTHTRADWTQWQPQGRAETTDNHGEPPTHTVHGTLEVPWSARGTYRLGLKLAGHHNGGEPRHVRCANATVDWAEGVNVVAQVQL
ncbi:DUF4874 domain-containing protein [Streptomyces sp. M41]|uniref:DUF4874 domain-containing protein n=1 Tax=Streptomyces sp. M41 TaxID=3059412 RepID=UPI00374CA252